MKKLLLFLFLSICAFGQGSPTSTTLSLAADNSQTYIVPAALTGFVARFNGTVQAVVYVDREAMFVNLLNAPLSGAVSVTRGVLGTVSSSHASGVTVLVGAPSMFYEGDPYGSCPNPLQSTPWINVRTGVQWTCSSGVWAQATGGGSGMADPGGNGIVVRTSLNTTTNRSVAATSPLTVSNADGTAGNPTAACPTCEVLLASPIPSSDTLNCTSLSSVQNFATTVNIPANTLVTSHGLEVTACGEITTGAGVVGLEFFLKLGSTTVYQSTNSNDSANQTAQSRCGRFIIQGEAAAGASANVRSHVMGIVPGTASQVPIVANQTTQPVALATNGSLTLQPALQCIATDANTSFKLTVLEVSQF